MNRSWLKTLVVAAGIALSTGVLLSAVNYKQIQVFQIGYYQYIDGVWHPCVYGLFSESSTWANVYLVGTSAVEEDRMLRMAVTALEKNFYAVVDLQSNGSIYYSPIFAVQNVPVAGARPAAAASALPAFPGAPPASAQGGGAGGVSTRQVPTNPQAPASDWRLVTVATVMTQTYTDGSIHPWMSVTEDGIAYYNVYIVGSDTVRDNWGFLLGLTALRCGLKAVIDHEESTPGIVYTPTVYLQNVLVP